MTTRTWIGGHGGNQISNALNWSPNGAPQPGDVLTATHGTINISGRQLPSGDELDVSGSTTVNVRGGLEDSIRVGAGNTTINLTNSVAQTIYTANEASGPLAGSVTINASGINQADISPPSRDFNGATTIHNSGVLIGGLHPFGGNLTLDGGTFVNTGSGAGSDGSDVVVNADVIGNGIWGLGTFHSPFGRLEFMQSVGAQQTVDLEGTSSGLGVTDLVLDQVSTFKATIDFNENSIIDLPGLVADAWSYPGGGATPDLRLYSGTSHQLVADLNFSDAAGVQFAVAQGTSTGAPGVEIFSSGPASLPIPHSGNLLLQL
jgi:hypothetical protein